MSQCYERSRAKLGSSLKSECMSLVVIDPGAVTEALEHARLHARQSSTLLPHTRGFSACCSLNHFGMTDSR